MNLLKKEFDVVIQKTPKTKPIGGYERKWFTLWLLPVAKIQYRLESDMVLLITFKNEEKFTFVIPKGFICDFASIPRLFWSIYPPDGNHRYPSIPHDMGYKAEIMREFMDRLFKKLLAKSDTPKQVQRVFYSNVSLFGRFVYMGHKKEEVEKARELFIDANTKESVKLFLGVEK